MGRLSLVPAEPFATETSVGSGYWLRLDGEPCSFHDFSTLVELGCMGVKLAGGSHHGAHLQDPAFAVGQQVSLRAAPQGQFDHPAVEVRSADELLHAGYLPKAKLRSYRRCVKACSPAQLAALIVYEWRLHETRERTGLTLLLGPQEKVPRPPGWWRRP